MKRSLLASLVSLAGASVLLGGGSAMAATSSFFVDLNKSFGDSYTGVTGKMDFLFGDAGDADATTYTLDLTIENTSTAPIISSSITGFAFDTPTGVSNFLYDRLTTNFSKATDNEFSNTQSFGFCAMTDNNTNNGTNCGAGSATQGLTMDSAASRKGKVKFTFNFAGGPGVSSVSSAFYDLFNGLEIQPAPNNNDAVKNTVVLAARFQAISTATSSGGSDKVTGKPRDRKDNSPRDAVPGPLPVLGAAAAFVQSRRLRRRLAAARSADTTTG